MLEAPDEFFNDEDGSCFEAGDMVDSKEETNGHTLDSNNYDYHRCCFHNREAMKAHVIG